MGAAASCKNSRSTTQNQQKNDHKNITIGVFGLDDAGKTSTVKAIEGEPTNDVVPTIGSLSTLVTNPLNEKTDGINKNKKQQNIRIIDVSGERKFRQKSWSQYYDQIHGLIFVIDASEKRRLNENQETLEELLGNEKLKNKPILILANKQDQRGAISTEYDLKRQLEIEKLKTKHKIEVCTALPQKYKNKVDESIRKGFLWLIRTIDENYTDLNARVTKSNSTRMSRKTNQSESDERDNDNNYSKGKNTDYRSKITSEKLPSINASKNKIKLYSDDDNDQNYSSSPKDFNKKKKLLGTTTNYDKSIKKSSDNEPKAFRSAYESFPEETPWASSPMLRPTKSDDTLPRLYTKPSITSDIKRRDVSPLVHDTKSYSTGSLSKRYNHSDDEDDFNRQQKSKTTNRFDYSTNKFSSNTKKTTSSIYEDDEDDYNNNNNRHIATTSKKSYNRDDDHDDDDQYNYLKKSTTTTKSNKYYDFDDNKTYPRSPNRSNLNNDYRGTSSKIASHSKYDDDYDDYYSTSKPITRSTYNNDYSTSKSTNHSKYNDDDDDDDDYPTSKSAGRSKYDDDDDYPSSSTKAVTHSKYDNDDDDDYYPNSSKKNNYSSPYTSATSRFRSENDDFFTTKGGTNNTNRFHKTTDYDS